MNPLQETVDLKGLGQKVSSTKILRNNNLCLYKRSDDIYEVFFVNKNKEGILFGKHYPERESYPNNEDFGRTAWCYTSEEKARGKFYDLEQLNKIEL